MAVAALGMDLQVSRCPLEKVAVAAAAPARPEEERWQRIPDPLGQRAGFAREPLGKADLPVQLESMRVVPDCHSREYCPRGPGQTLVQQTKTLPEEAWQTPEVPR